MESACRLCLKESFDLSSVFQFKNGQIVVDLIKNIIPEIRIERSDEHSKMICSECLEVISSAVELRTVSINNAIKMGCLMHNFDDISDAIVKQENPSEIENHLANPENFRLEPSGKLLGKTDDSLFREEMIKVEKVDSAIIDFEVIDCSSIKQEIVLNDKIENPKKKTKKSFALDFKGFRCDVCDMNGISRMFRWNKNLVAHMKANHKNYSVGKSRRSKSRSKQTERFSCNECESSFGSRFSLNAHGKCHRATNNSTPEVGDFSEYFKCNICESRGVTRTFKWNKNLVAHMKAHGGDVHGTDKSVVKRKPREEAESFYCNECQRSFGSKFSLNAHGRTHRASSSFHNLRDHSSSKYFKCDLCGGSRMFKWKRNLIAHMKAHKTGFVGRAKKKRKSLTFPASLTCDKCDLMFSTKLALSSHRKSHSKLAADETPCSVCNSNFKLCARLNLNNSNSFVHCDYVEEYLEPNQMFTCSLCVFQSPTDEDLQLHLLSHRDEFNSSKFVGCVKCTRTIRDFNNLIDHSNHHNQKITHRCLKCRKTFPYGTKLLRHLRRHQSLFICDLCGHGKSSKRMLEDHINTAHKKEVCFLCPICGDAKLSHAAFVRHMKWTHDDKKYKCSLCPKSFQNLAHYHLHQSAHSSVTSFQCQKCPKKFKTHQYLKRHERYHDPSKHKYRYACDHCDKKFYWNHSLKPHMLTHTGVLPWICDFEGCDKAFSQKNNLNIHLRTHYGKNIFKCEFPGCSLAFKLKRELRIHKSDHYTRCFDGDEGGKFEENL